MELGRQQQGEGCDEQEVELPAGVELTWVHGGNGHAPSRVEEIVRASEFPKDPGYVWVAGETKVTRGVRRYLRLGLGTGVMGGYTTYSSFAVETVRLFGEGGAAVFVGIGYALGSVVLGLAAAFAGMWLAARWSR